jgi:hypothetical protein
MLAGCAAESSRLESGKASDRPKPGFIRLLNLSPGSVAMFDGNRAMVPPVATKSASSFTTFPAGNKIMQIKGQSIDLKVEPKLSAGTGTLIILGSSGKTSSTIADTRQPESGHNLRLLYLDLEGSPQTNGPPVTLSNGETTLHISAREPAVKIPSGNWKIAALNLVSPDPLAIKPDSLYDLVLAKDNTGRYLEIPLSELVHEKATIAERRSFR